MNTISSFAVKITSCAGMVLTFLMLFTGPANSDPGGTGYSEFFESADRFLKKYVVSGKVDYASVSKNERSLDELIEMAVLLPPSGDGAREKAFWINVYNLLVIRSVIDHYPEIKSPLGVSDFFNGERFRIRGTMYSLDKIEKETLFPKYPDARIHFVLVCAAKGCPPLLKGAYLPEKLESQLQSQTRRALNDPGFIRLDDEKKSIAISELFKWYKHDYEREEGTVRKFINKFRDTGLPADYKMFYYSYNWDLNDSQ